MCRSIVNYLKNAHNKLINRTRIFAPPTIISEPRKATSITILQRIVEHDLNICIIKSSWEIF